MTKEENYIKVLFLLNIFKRMNPTDIGMKIMDLLSTYEVMFLVPALIMALQNAYRLILNRTLILSNFQSSAGTAFITEKQIKKMKKWKKISD